MRFQRAAAFYRFTQKARAELRWGVASAVQNFTRDVGAVLRVTYLSDCYSFPAWYIVKPPPSASGPVAVGSD